MKPIPTEMRNRILQDCDKGMSEKAAAEKWNLGRSTIAKFKNQRRKTGSLEPIKPKTGPKPKLAEHRELLKQIVTETPDATLAEIQKKLPVAVSHQTVANELIKLKLVYKKNVKSRRTTTPRCRRKTRGLESGTTWFEPEKVGVFG